MPEETKGILKSKINVSALLLIICSAISDPMFKAYFGDWIPPGILMKVNFLVGWAIIYFRSNAEINIPLDWRNPWKGENPKV
jgi:hypothetical protein